jgi:hypothetical protein
LQIIEEGRISHTKAAEELRIYQHEFPELVRAVKTRDTSKTVLMHKDRHVTALHKVGVLKTKEANAIRVRFCRLPVTSGH